MDNNTKAAGVAVGVISPRQSSWREKEDDSPKSSRSKRRDRTSERHKDEDDPESRDRRTKRREKEDRDAKRRSPFRSSKAAVHGAHSSTGEHKSSRKARRPSSPASVGSPSRSRSGTASTSRKDKDEKAAYRKSRSASASASASAPGAQKEDGSPSGRRREKGKERRSTRATRPGAESASYSSKDRSKSKSGGKGSRATVNEADIAIESSSSMPHIGEDGEPVVAAIIVEEDDEDEQEKRKAREEARLKQAVAAQTENQRRQMEEENQRLRDEMERNEAKRLEAERKKKKRNTIICVVLVLLIGVGVGVFFATQGGTTTTTDNNVDVTPDTSTADDDMPLVDPSLGPSDSPSVDPTEKPSNSPSLFLKYDLPSDEECERIANDLPLDGEENMDIKTFDIQIDLGLSDESNVEPLIPDLQTRLEEFIVPDLIGCPRQGVVEGRRWLQQEEEEKDLTWENIRYAIAKAQISVDTADGETCQDTGSASCTVLTATIILTVREAEKILSLISILSTALKAGENLNTELQLQAPFDVVVVRLIESKDPTEAPTSGPTRIASETPTSFPTTTPTSSPTFAPVIGPTTSQPTKNPTMAPTKNPTTSPTSGPTPTPPPTLAPQPGVTPPPTTTPSNIPSNTPSKMPSINPSFVPSWIPSMMPSMNPSSPAPTNGPTNGPTNDPTYRPTSSPTYGPTSPAPTSSYLGCYVDGSNRVMDVYLGTLVNVQDCRDFCKGLGYPYAGVQFSNQCFCGNAYDRLGSGSGCTSTCWDSADQYCGGAYRNSVYLSGIDVASSPLVAALENELYCGCYTALISSGQELTHQAPHPNMSQQACIRYCYSQGYNFAGLQSNRHCLCGDSAGDGGMSLNCFYNVGRCFVAGSRACYDEPNPCECGGADANTLFRTSQSVSCPSTTLPSDSYIECKADQASNPDLPILGSSAVSVADCQDICKDIGFTYAGMQAGRECRCGNSYSKHGSASNCNTACIQDSSESNCGGSSSNSVYYSGAAVAPVTDLEDNLYCGCFTDVDTARDLEHQSPYSFMFQNGCIHYCRSKNYDFAGIQFTLRVATMVVRHVLVVETAQTICSEQAKAYLVLAGDRVLER
ncbi:MAG: hypothetical protein SGBAC_012506 [Bacillariaceae sp.]